MKPLRTGVIGFGRFGALHARVLAQLPHVDLVGICSRSEERVGEVAVGLAIVKSAERGAPVSMGAGS